MIAIIISAFVVSCISFTITWTSIFRPIREKIGSWHPKLDELMHCPWCFSHYVAFIMVYTSELEVPIVSDIAFYQFMFTSFAIIGISGVIHYILLRAYEPVAKASVMRQLEKVNKKGVPQTQEKS
jgi:hypothetical protein